MDKNLNNSGQEPIAHNEDFAKTVEESKQKIHEAGLVEVKKRGRGRPSKASTQTNAQPQTGPAPNISGPTMAPGPQPPVDVTPLLCPPIVALSKIPANKHNIPELAFTDDEAKTCASALNEVLKAFIPDVNQMSPKTAAILGAFVTFGSIGFTKYQVYLDKKPKKIDPEPVPEIQELNKENPHRIMAENYFNRF